MQIDPNIDPESARFLARITAPRRRDEARGHHTISRFYLNRFADDDERLAVVRINDAKPDRQVRKTKNVAVENDFYTFIDTAGAENPAVERLLAEIEGPAAAAMRKLSEGVFFPPGRQDRAYLATWLALQMTRGPEKRREIEALADAATKINFKSIDTVEKARARLLASGAVDPTTDQIEGLLGWARDIDRFEFVPHPNDHISVMLDLALDELAPRLWGMSWAVGKFEKAALLSGDHPITFFVRECLDPRSGVGLETADEVWFPVDPSTVLILTWDRVEERVIQLPLRHAIDINQNTLFHAFEFVFMHPAQDHLTGLTFPTGPHPVLHVEGATNGESSDGVNKPPKRLRPKRRRR